MQNIMVIKSTYEISQVAVYIFGVWVWCEKCKVKIGSRKGPHFYCGGHFYTCKWNPLCIGQGVCHLSVPCLRLL